MRHQCTNREDLAKVCQNLESTNSDSPTAQRTATATGSPAPASNADAAAAAAAAGGVADALLAAQLRVMTQKAAGFERQLRQAQVEGESLKEQLATLEFEKTELGQQDEFERGARLFAEEQLQEAQREASALRQQLGQARQMVADVRAELEALQRQRADAEGRWTEERVALGVRVKRAEGERDEALDRLNFQVGGLVAPGGSEVGGSRFWLWRRWCVQVDLGWSWVLESFSVLLLAADQ